MFFAIIALLLTPTFASAEIKVSPPPNWQPAPNNNSTSMVCGMVSKFYKKRHWDKKGS
jgi:hypothetical protein